MMREFGLLYQGKGEPIYKDRSKWKGWLSGWFVPLTFFHLIKAVRDSVI